MIEFFREGGWGMWPILIFGMVTVGAALRFAQKPEDAQLKFLGAMGLTTLVTTVHATWTDVAAVMHTLSDPARVSDAELTRTLFVGLMESTRPGTLAGIMLTLACLLMAIGALRAQKTKSEA